jgi:large subunit ribosomal protein L34e
MAHLAKKIRGKSKIESSGRPMHKSRSLKRARVRTPGGRTVTRYKRKKTAPHKCALCKNELHGTPSNNPIALGKLKKSQKRPSRPFGGQLCSKCTRDVIAYKAQALTGEVKKEELPITIQHYL